MVRCGPAKVYTCRIMRPRTYFVNALRAAEGDTKSSGFTKRAASVNQAFAKKILSNSRKLCCNSNRCYEFSCDTPDSWFHASHGQNFRFH